VSPSIRTASTLVALAALLVVGLAWGWSAATSPLPESTSSTPDGCTPIEVAAGEEVYPDQVLVSVLNAGSKDGLAQSTMQLLVDQGFGFGERGNAADGTEVARAVIWTDDPDGPATRLVASWLGKGVEITTGETTAPGVVVVVGDRFKKLAKGRKSITAEADATLCGPEPVVPE
jgi:hypothetical protein